jgi:hypothetical protein
MVQTAVTTALAVGREGQIAQGGARDLVSGFASAALKYGLLLQRGAGDRVVKPMDVLPAADVDAFAVGPLATAATAQVFSGSDFDGVVGAGLVPGYSQRASFVLNNHADWDATVMKVRYENPNGVEVVEDVDIPNGGNTTVYTLGAVSILKSVHLPAQSGTNGEFTIGQDPTAAYVGLDPRIFPGIGCYDPAKESYAAATEVAQYGEVDVMKRGRVWVVVEAAVTDGMPVYVRAVLSGADVRGQFRGTPAANFVRLPGAHFVTTQASADGVAVVQLGGVA